jgi:hypothetical protein
MSKLDNADNDEIALVRQAFADRCADPDASQRRTLALIEAGARMAGRRTRRRPFARSWSRRRVFAVAAVAAVAVLVAAVPLLVSMTVPHRPAPGISSGPSGSPAAPYRRPLELTVALTAARAPYLMDYGTTGGAQFIKISTASGAGPDFTAGVVLVYDPGALDPGVFAGGEPVPVHGRTGHLIHDFLIGHRQDPDGTTHEIRTSAIGWPDPSGAWVVVHGLTGTDNLVALGDAVDLGARHPLPAPYRLGYLPPGVAALPVSYAQNRTTPGDGAGSVDSVLSFGGSPPETWHPFVEPSADVPLTIRVNDRSHYSDLQDGPPDRTKIAGYDGWFFTAGSAGLTGAAARLLVKTDTCRVEITVNDQGRYPLEQLTRIVEGMQIRDCTNRATWTAALD